MSRSHVGQPDLSEAPPTNYPRGGGGAFVGVERGPISSNAWGLGVEWIRAGADKDRWQTKVSEDDTEGGVQRPRRWRMQNARVCGLPIRSF